MTLPDRAKQSVRRELSGVSYSRVYLYNSSVVESSGFLGQVEKINGNGECGMGNEKARSSARLAATR